MLYKGQPKKVNFMGRDKMTNDAEFENAVILLTVPFSKVSQN